MRITSVAKSSRNRLGRFQCIQKRSTSLVFEYKQALRILLSKQKVLFLIVPYAAS
jgi:hypothetical protein